MFSAARAPSTANCSASRQRPCQTSATEIQLRTELTTGWVDPSTRLIASLKHSWAPTKSPRSASMLPLHDSE